MAGDKSTKTVADLGTMKVEPIKAFVLPAAEAKTTHLSTFTPIKRIEMTLVGYADQDGEERVVNLGTIVAQPKDFTTGSTGLSYNGPVADPSSRSTFRVNANLVVQGSGKALAAGA